MPPESPANPEEGGLIIPPSTGLVRFPVDGSPVLSEIISRSLVHIQTSQALGMLHRIGEHELYGPDYQLICALADQEDMNPEHVLNLLLSCSNPYFERGELVDFDHPQMAIEDNRIVFIEFPPDAYFSKIVTFPEIIGLRIERLYSGPNFPNLKLFPFLKHLDLSSDVESLVLQAPNLLVLHCRCGQLAHLDLSGVSNLTELVCSDSRLTDLDLSGVPNLTKLHCSGNQLTRLDLSGVSNLTELVCSDNQLTDLDLSAVPNLTKLHCSINQLTRLDLSGVSNLTELCCSDNQLANLDLSAVPNLVELFCGNNRLKEVDLSRIPNLKDLDCRGNPLTDLEFRNPTDLYRDLFTFL